VTESEHSRHHDPGETGHECGFIPDSTDDKEIAPDSRDAEVVVGNPRDPEDVVAHPEEPKNVVVQPRDPKEVVVQYEDLEIRAPFYDETVVFTKERREFESMMFSEIRKFGVDSSKKLLYDGQSVWIYSAMNIFPAWNTFSRLRRSYKTLIKNDPSPRMTDAYGEMSKNLIDAIADAKSDIKLDPKDAHKLMEKSLNALQALVDESPVGTYLAWDRVKFNGQSMIEYYAPVAQALRDNGYSVVLTFIHKLVGAV